MRIIAGKARGRAIKAPEGRETRPVTDMIRESLFNIWQFDIEGADFLDLFSGSGCMGLEALSRGAARVAMVDASPVAVRVIKENLAKTGLASEPNEVLKADVLDAIGRFKRTRRTFDVIYVDPPFTMPELYGPVMEALGDAALLKSGGELAIRSASKRMELPERVGDLERVREKRYGASTVSFYRKADDAPEQGGVCEYQASRDVCGGSREGLVL